LSLKVVKPSEVGIRPNLRQTLAYLETSHFFGNLARGRVIDSEAKRLALVLIKKYKDNNTIFPRSTQH
jgi:hypothetical protein